MSATRHLGTDEIAGYQRRTLTPATLLAVSDHLQQCDVCRGRLDETGWAGKTVEDIQARFDAAVTEIEHPTPDEVARFVDGTLDDVDNEIVLSHLSTCATCAEDVDDLRRVAADLAAISKQPARQRPRLSRLAAVAALAAGLAGSIIWIAVELRPANDEARVAGPALEPRTSAPAALDNPTTIADGSVTVTLHSDGRFDGLPPGLSPDDVQAIHAALTGRGLTIPAVLAGLAVQPGTLMSRAPEPPSFALLTPLSTAVESDRPAFTWTPLPGATSYVVSIFDPAFNKVAESRLLTVPAWRPDRTLARGRSYVWQVRAAFSGGDLVAPSPPAPPARFHLLSQAEADRVAEIRRHSGASALALGVLLAQAGIVDDAERELDRLAAANPTVSVIQQLRDSLRSHRMGGRDPK